MSPRYDGLTENQDRVLANIALGGNAHGENRRTVAALLSRGLIVKIGEEVVYRDRFGVVTAPVYEMPIVEHIRWCAWCAEHYPDAALIGGPP
jgi:hypothetical protein